MLAQISKKNYTKSELFNLQVMRLFQFGFTRPDQSDEKQTIFRTKESYPACEKNSTKKAPSDRVLKPCLLKHGKTSLGLEHFRPLMRSFASGIVLSVVVFLLELCLTRMMDKVFQWRKSKYFAEA